MEQYVIGPLTGISWFISVPSDDNDIKNYDSLFACSFSIISYSHGIFLNYHLEEIIA